MSTNRELLELAAKSIGTRYVDGASWDKEAGWNPLDDDGDALRLAVKLNMTVLADPGIDGSVAAQIDPPLSPHSVWADEVAVPDHYAATRRAIVRAAAEIGRTMK
jgi:hypothetical protein